MKSCCNARLPWLRLAALCLLSGALVNLAHAQDFDGDGVSDLQDNCVVAVNSSQQDSDQDQIGNRCDTDLNNDGVTNLLDVLLFQKLMPTNEPVADFDGNGVVNGVDYVILTTGLGTSPGPSGLLPDGLAFWVGAEDGSWHDPDNWSAGQTPSSAQTAILDRQGDNLTVSISQSINVGGIYSNEAIDISGRFIVVRVSGPSELNAGLSVGSTVEFNAAGNQADIVVNGDTLFDGRLRAIGGGTVRMNGLVDLMVREDMIRLEASGPGSEIHLPVLTSATVDAADGQLRLLNVHADDGGIIEFSELTTVQAVGDQAWVELLVRDPGSRIDANVLTTLGGTSALGSPLIIAADGGEINLLQMAELSFIDLRIVGDAHIRLGAVSSFTDASFEAVGTTPEVPFAHLTTLTNVELYADSGAIITLPVLQSVVSTAARTGLYATGNGSAISLPSLESVDVLPNSSGVFPSRFLVSARSGGTIEMPTLSQLALNSDTAEDDSIEVSADGDDSLISIPSLSSIARNSPGDLIEIDTRSGALIRLDAVETFEDVELVGWGGTLYAPLLRSITHSSIHARGSAVAPINYNAITDITGTSLIVEQTAQIVLPSVTSLQVGNRTEFRAGGTASLIDLPFLETIVVDGQAASGTDGEFRAMALFGGTISLAGLTSISCLENSVVQNSAYFEVAADGETTQVLTPALVRWSDDDFESPSTIRAAFDGSYSPPLLAEMDGGELDFPAVIQYSAHAAFHWDASDADSAIRFPALESIEVDVQQDGATDAQIAAFWGASVDLPVLRHIAVLDSMASGSIDVRARGPGSLVSMPRLKTWKDFDGSTPSIAEQTLGGFVTYPTNSWFINVEELSPYREPIPGKRSRVTPDRR